METNKILEGNKLIAIFMGRCGKRNKRLYWVNIPGVEWVYVEDMKFHSSWDWLMPVVEKILNICQENDEMEKYYTITDAIPDIESVWLACVEFVKWYNEQK